MPFAFVDLDLFDANVRDIAARAGKLPIRIGSKSMRCTWLMRRVLEASPQYRGILAYSVREAVFLASEGFDDILVAYPALSDAEGSGVCEALAGGGRITLMVDCAEHVTRLNRLGAAAGVTLPLCMDIDMASQYPGLYFGVRRSPIATPAQALELYAQIRACPNVRLEGVMGYEAQIAGLQDRAPGKPWKNRLVRVLKRRSTPEVCARRLAIVEALRKAGAELRLVNGGGTGSIEATGRDPSVTEVTVGSGFYSPALFDYYDHFRHCPAVAYAIEVVRRAGPAVYTCQGGGYVASGAAGPDKQPKPYLPEGASLIAQEGAGEVQTPIVYDGPEPLELGAPVFMRHAKSGELCERFHTLLCVAGGKVVDEIPTYRGQGQCFL